MCFRLASGTHSNSRALALFLLRYDRNFVGFKYIYLLLRTHALFENLIRSIPDCTTRSHPYNTRQRCIPQRHRSFFSDDCGHEMEPSTVHCHSGLIACLDPLYHQFGFSYIKLNHKFQVSKAPCQLHTLTCEQDLDETNISSQW